MSQWVDHPVLSLQRRLLFWWILFVMIQQAERLFLLLDAWWVEPPTAGVLAKTLVVGLRGDFIVATIGLALAAGLALLFIPLMGAWEKIRSRRPRVGSLYNDSFSASCVMVALVLTGFMLVDMGYYSYNRQHLNFVFFEYMEDLVSPVSAQLAGGAQAARQTVAELQQIREWAGRVLGFFGFQFGAIGLWWWGFSRVVSPGLSRITIRSPLRANVLLSVCLLAGASGFHYQGPYALRIAEIQSATYYTLAQNPLLYASEALRAARMSRVQSGFMSRLDLMPLEEAVKLTQDLVGHGASFPDPEYPFVKGMASSGEGVRLDQPANVLLIFIEGLDRRYLGRTIQNVRVTPFLDQLQKDSVYFERFFANGVQTSRGLFASYCSYGPRQGASAMKTRYAHDYLCLPSALKKHGYRTEMVISQHRDLNRLQLFMARNGLDQLFSESDFPLDAERVGLGLTDAALFDFVRSRIETLQASRRPFFLSTLTLSTHHPFAVPLADSGVIALQAEPDKYVAALRYVDQELERLFIRLRKEKLLDQTLVFILGDHGRHEAVGRTEIDKQAGHFAAPLLIWMDESLRRPDRYRPRVITGVASQVDLAPTILAINGLTPTLAPFWGRDISCALVTDCLEDNVAFLSSVYDDLIGLADRQGLLLYSLRTETFKWTTLEFEDAIQDLPADDPVVALRHRRLLALYESANRILDENRIWSWKKFGEKL